jgi:hypothetical protein
LEFTAEFNAGFGDARFSPIETTDGSSISTLYAGGTLPVALMETIFHDVPAIPGFKTLDSSKLDGQEVSLLSVSKKLSLVSLQTVALRKQGY